MSHHVFSLIGGFVLTALLTTLFGYTSMLGTAVAGLSEDFTTKFNGLSILGIALIGFAIASLHYKKLIETPKVVAAVNPNDVEEIEDDEI